jgi:hypothetical protein
MANQTVTTGTIAAPINYDDALIAPLLNGETLTINGGAVRIDSDVRWNQQAAVFGNITLSTTLGGLLAFDGSQVWEVPFSASTGNVPTQGALGTNGVTGGTSGATGELTRVWASASFDPAAAGAAMPATGFIKLRSKTGTFQNGETITLPNGATITASGAGKRSWLHVVGASGSSLTMPRMASVSFTGDWYEIGTTNGADNQTIQMPVREEFPGIQIETSPGSGVYEWWVNAADSWNGWYPSTDAWTATNATFTRNAIAAPANFPAAERLRETATAGFHGVNGQVLLSTQMDAGSYTHRAVVKSETRQWCVVQISTNGGTDRYGALVDLTAGTIIANPSVGSPTGVSSSIASLGDGYYQVDVTLTHATGILTSIVAISDSATPTYASGLPTYTGNTTQGIYVGFTTLIQNTHAFIPTDVRGKFFYSDPFAGTIQLAKRGANNAGLKPASGCKIRIPNLIFGTTTAANYAAQHISTLNRYLINFSNGFFDADKITCNWLSSNSPAYFRLQNSAQSALTNFANFYSEFRNCCISPCLAAFTSSGTVTLQNSANAFLYDSRFVRSSGIAIFVNACANVRSYRTCFEQIKYSAGKSQRITANHAVADVRCSGGEFVDCTFINGGGQFNVQNFLIKNLTYCDNMTGTTPAFTSYALNCQGANIVIDGVRELDGVSNNHPHGHYLTTSGFTANVVVKNIGSPTSPLNAGTNNPCGYIASFVAAGTTVEMRRCYVDNLRQGVVLLSASSPNFIGYDIWGNGSTPQSITTGNALFRGSRWTNQRTAQSGNQGSHWDDAHTSTTTGLITISANEPTAASIAQCSATLGQGSGFNGSGSMIISRLTDVVVWTAPLKMYGHSAFAGGCAISGTDCQNLIFEYKIDTGSGFGASWAFLANTVRRASGGTSGTNTVNVSTADQTALTRKPQVGDFVQTGSFRLPANTTVTNVSGNVITCSANFTASLVNNEFVTFSPVNEAVTAASGYLLQVRTYPTVAAATTLLTAFSMGIQTNATAQQIPHPLPGITLAFTGLQAGTEVRVYRASDSVELAGTDATTGNVFLYEYEYLSDVPIFVTFIKPGYKWRRIDSLLLKEFNQNILIFQ